MRALPALPVSCAGLQTRGWMVDVPVGDASPSDDALAHFDEGSGGV